MNAKEYLDILHIAEKLKDTPRHSTTSKRRVESVAEHSWRISLMALLLRREFPDLNTDRVVSMCLIHDLGECFTGDIPAFVKTDSDRKTEDDLLASWVSSMPSEVAEDLSDLYREMEEQETMESKVFKALDKLEALIQHNESPVDTWSENEYELNRVYAFDKVGFDQWLTSLRGEILKETEAKIKRERLYASDTCDVFYAADKNVVLVNWKSYCEKELYRRPLNIALQTIKDHPGCNYVADTRNGFEDNPEDTEWVARVFMPKAKEYGCEIIYFIIDRGNSLKEELEGQEKDSSSLLKFRYIYDIKECPDA